ncbi:MAG: DUF362 domain-containing protein [Deltaproteobacteria bacterium]|nr:DUF362 domain-containing protein [Deltaproteobacteria bacterium]
MTESGCYFAAQTGYQPAAIRAHLENGLAALALERRISAGDRVLLKPNLVLGKAPAAAVTTHPQMLRAVAELLLDCGARLYVGDSPGYGSLESCMEKSGLAPVARELGLTPFPLTEGPARPAGARGRLRLAAGLDDFDHLVNLPKLKTHAMMGVTLAVKNLFGLVPGFNKARWHLRAGHNRQLFARYILEIYRARPPVWNFLDGITGMEGEGPTSGKPRSCGLLALSANGPALDFLVEKWLGFSQPSPLSTEALQQGLIVPEQKAVGPAAATCLQPPLRPARSYKQATFPLQRWWGSFFVKRPKVAVSRCRRCLVCVEHCPAAAMRLVDGRIVINQKKCIHCYCCQELCPYGAVRIG